MGYDANTVRIFLADLMRSPLKTICGTFRNIGQRFSKDPQTERLRRLTREAPFILQIETINVCNAECVFCAYPGMKRKKGVMDLALFEKIVSDYAEMGGGPVSLTPVVGDALLDPHIMERLKILKKYPEIVQITVTTNGIALDRFSDDEIVRLIKDIYCIQMSIGGLDAATYEMLYGVDRFSQVERGMERLMALRERVSPAAEISFAFRTNDRKFEARFRERLDGYRKRGVFISNLWTYANYSGMVKNNKDQGLIVLTSKGNKRCTCVYGSIGMSVCWDGTVTACGCADFEGNQLAIGHAAKERLADIWFGKKRNAILDSFATGSIPKICRNCSAYQPDTIFANPCFDGIESHRPLPLDFFRHFWGG